MTLKIAKVIIRLPFPPDCLRLRSNPGTGTYASLISFSGTFISALLTTYECPLSQGASFVWSRPPLAPPQGSLSCHLCVTVHFSAFSFSSHGLVLSHCVLWADLCADFRISPDVLAHSKAVCLSHERVELLTVICPLSFLPEVIVVICPWRSLTYLPAPFSHPDFPINSHLMWVCLLLGPSPTPLCFSFHKSCD